MKKILLILSLASLQLINCSEQINHNSVEQKVTKEQEEALLRQPLILSLSKDEGQANKMLLKAVKNFDVKKVEEALSAGADINAKNVYGRTALHIASYHDRKDIAELLIKYGADVNAKDNDGWTALIYASIYNSKDITKLLIKYGADLNAKDNKGETALMKASSMWTSNKGHKEIAELLINAGADINTKDNYGRTALMFALMHYHKDIEVLLKYWAPYSKEYYEDKANGFKKFNEKYISKINSELNKYLIKDLSNIVIGYFEPTFQDWMELDKFNNLGNKLLKKEDEALFKHVCLIKNMQTVKVTNSEPNEERCSCIIS